MMRRPKLTSADRKRPGSFDTPDGDESQSDLTPKGRAHDPAVFDNLSKTLAKHARKLSDEEARFEEGVRTELLASLKDYRIDRSKLGSVLVRYRPFYKSKRQWTGIVTAIGKTIDLSSRTVFRIIDDFDPDREDGTDHGVDRAAIDGPPLTKRERLERDARLAIRSLLNDLGEGEKTKTLLRILAEEAHQVWGQTEEMTLRFTPTPSRFTIDGRKKNDAKKAGASAA